MWVGNECHQLLPWAVFGILHGLVGFKKILNTNRLTNTSLVNIAEKGANFIFVCVLLIMVINFPL